MSKQHVQVNKFYMGKQYIHENTFYMSTRYIHILYEQTAHSREHILYEQTAFKRTHSICANGTFKRRHSREHILYALTAHSREHILYAQTASSSRLRAQSRQTYIQENTFSKKNPHNKFKRTHFYLSNNAFKRTHSQIEPETRRGRRQRCSTRSFGCGTWMSHLPWAGRAVLRSEPSRKRLGGQGRRGGGCQEWGDFT